MQQQPYAASPHLWTCLPRSEAIDDRPLPPAPLPEPLRKPPKMPDKATKPKLPPKPLSKIFSSCEHGTAVLEVFFYIVLYYSLYSYFVPTHRLVLRFILFSGCRCGFYSWTRGYRPPLQSLHITATQIHWPGSTTHQASHDRYLFFSFPHTGLQCFSCRRDPLWRHFDSRGQQEDVLCPQSHHGFIQRLFQGHVYWYVISMDFKVLMIVSLEEMLPSSHVVPALSPPEASHYKLWTHTSRESKREFNSTFLTWMGEKTETKHGFRRDPFLYVLIFKKSHVHDTVRWKTCNFWSVMQKTQLISLNNDQR